MLPYSTLTRPKPHQRRACSVVFMLRVVIASALCAMVANMVYHVVSIRYPQRIPNAWWKMLQHTAEKLVTTDPTQISKDLPLADQIYEHIHGSGSSMNDEYFEDDIVAAVGQDCLFKDVYENALRPDKWSSLLRTRRTASAPQGNSSSLLCQWYPAPGRRIQCCCAGSALRTALAGEAPQDGDNNKDNNNDAPLKCFPSFIIIGAQKGGTTALLAFALQHPSVLAPVKKEVHYFDRNQYGEVHPVQYLAYFPDMKALEAADANDEAAARINGWSTNEINNFAQVLQQPLSVVLRVASKITGETSPSYMLGMETMRLVAHMIPGVRIIVMLRNPVDRAYSEFQMHRRSTGLKEQLLDGGVKQLIINGTNYCRSNIDFEPDSGKKSFQTCVMESLMSQNAASMVRKSSKLMGLLACVEQQMIRHGDGNAWQACFTAADTQYLNDITRSFESQWRTQTKQLQHCGGRSLDSPITLDDLLREDAPYIAGRHAAVVVPPFSPGQPSWPGCLSSRKGFDAARHVLPDGRKNCFFKGATSDIRQDYLYRSLYANQILRVFAWIKRSHVLVIESNMLKHHAHTAFAAFTDFLGLHRFALDDSPGATTKIIDEKYPSFRKTGWSASGVYEPLSDALRQEMLQFFAPHNAALYDLLGCGFEWDR